VYLTIDTETGGIGDDISLLTLYMGFLDENFILKKELDLCVKPDDGVYKVNAQGLSINQIDLIEHDKVAITYGQAATVIYDFLNSINPSGKTKLIPIGHNVAFDIRFICQKTLSKKSWDKYVGYRCLDTGTISAFLISAKILPMQNASLETLASYFNIKFNAHTAKGDALATAQVLVKMLELVSKK